jgi:CheY-like chemotaxis protein
VPSASNNLPRHYGLVIDADLTGRYDLLLPAVSSAFRGRTGEFCVHQDPLVLLVEDDPQAREGYAEFLEIGGFRVNQADSAEQALAKALERPPDAVVTDIALPGRDGFALAAALRGQPRTHEIPIVAITAYWATDATDRARRSGITAILSKPCQPEHLIAELQRVLRQQRLPRIAQPSTITMTAGWIRLPEAKSHS